ncbi:MAG TPA: hypothetical protein VMX35_14485 [Acidobacteriota bacterium]|nr:hypothetical protein [Acidobacteriota bacterium]
MGHRRDHGVEETAGGSRGVDGLGERNEIRVIFPKQICEFEELFGIAGEAGKLGKNEAGDMSAFDVGEHLLRFRGVLDRLSRNRIKPVYLDYLPALGFCIEAGASLVRLRAFAPYLILG